jgi:hypothetical protein
MEELHKKSSFTTQNWWFEPKVERLHLWPASLAQKPALVFPSENFFVDLIVEYDIYCH